MCYSNYRGESGLTKTCVEGSTYGVWIGGKRSDCFTINKGLKGDKLWPVFLNITRESIVETVNEDPFFFGMKMNKDKTKYMTTTRT